MGAQNIPRDYWTATNTPAAATAAVASQAAVAGVKHVAKRAFFSLSTVAATAQTPLLVHLRDGATGAGTIKLSWSVAALGTTFAIVDADNLGIVGSTNTAMTLEMAAAGVANSQGTATLQGYDIKA